jgi:hypothetical protein
MSFEQRIGLGLGLPVLIGAISVLIGRLVGRKSKVPSAGAWCTVLGLGLAYLAGHLAITPRPVFPPVESRDWMLWIVLAATALGLIEALARLPRIVVWMLRAGVVAFLLWETFGLVRESWGTRLFVLLSLLIGGLILLCWWSLDALASRTRGSALPVAFAVYAFGIGVTLFLSRYALFAVVAITFAAAFLGAGLTAIRCSRCPLAHGSIAVVIAVTAGLILNGYFFAEMPPTTAILLAIAPLAIWIARVPRLGRWFGPLLSSVVYLAFLLGAIAITARVNDAFSAEPAASEEY